MANSLIYFWSVSLVGAGPFLHENGCYFIFGKVNFSLFCWKFKGDPVSAHVYNKFQSANSCFDFGWDCTLQGSVMNALPVTMLIKIFLYVLGVLLSNYKASLILK